MTVIPCGTSSARDQSTGIRTSTPGLEFSLNCFPQEKAGVTSNDTSPERTVKTDAFIRQFKLSGGVEEPLRLMQRYGVSALAELPGMVSAAVF